MAGTAAVVLPPPERVPLGPHDAGHHGPGAVIVRRRAAIRQPAEGEHRERVIGLLAQRKQAEALLLIRGKHVILEPEVAGRGGAQGERAHRGEKPVLVGALRANAPQIGDELRNRITVQRHRFLPRQVRPARSSPATSVAAMLHCKPRLPQKIVAIARRNPDVHRRAAARERQRNLGARGAQAPDLAEEIGEPRDALAADRDDEIARMDAGPLGRAAGGEPVDDQAALPIGGVDSEPGPRRTGRSPGPHEIVENGLEQVDGHEHVAVDGFVAGVLLQQQRPDADEPAILVEQRGAAPLGMRRRGEQRGVEQVFPEPGEFPLGKDRRLQRVGAPAVAQNVHVVVRRQRRRGPAFGRRAGPGGRAAGPGRSPSRNRKRAGAPERPSRRSRSARRTSASVIRYPMVRTRPSSRITTPLPVRSVPRTDAVNASSGNFGPQRDHAVQRRT